MNNSYSNEHWRKKIQSYLSEEWSTQPSPFAKQVAGTFKSGGKILELGTGAGQDGIWFEEQGFEVFLSDGNTDAFDTIQQKSIKLTRPVQFDLTQEFPFEDSSFDVVYAQLVLHYFDDKTMDHIMMEIYRVLSSQGILAFMVNTVNDTEYLAAKVDDSGIIKTNKLLKRYFSVETLAPFVINFTPILFDNQGRTPKDDAVGNAGMVQFVGVKR